MPRMTLGRKQRDGARPSLGSRPWSMGWHQQAVRLQTLWLSGSICDKPFSASSIRSSDRSRRARQHVPACRLQASSQQPAASSARPFRTVAWEATLTAAPQPSSSIAGPPCDCLASVQSLCLNTVFLRVAVGVWRCLYSSCQLTPWKYLACWLVSPIKAHARCWRLVRARLVLDSCLSTSSSPFLLLVSMESVPWQHRMNDRSFVPITWLITPHLISRHVALPRISTFLIRRRLSRQPASLSVRALCLRQLPPTSVGAPG
ncbi:hypothetical protein B0H63DRAFT_65010 [Podospora didyma]|uniref:Uncharacterized protein n=1 Tax=Podospora didyma TaxID=330526 RepID=A0AAE0P8D8_9PEZI|nr:hypothetical protein B0H63DRAFT_65010 [Podospora didyma]